MNCIGAPRLATERAVFPIRSGALIPIGVQRENRMTSYIEKLQDPRWQKKRLEILEAADWKCATCECKTKTLHVHHKIYRKGWQPWDYPNEDLQALCKDCHLSVSETRKRIDEAFALMDKADLQKVLGYCEGMLLFSFSQSISSISLNTLEYAEGVSDAISGPLMGAYELLDWREDRQLVHDDLINIRRQRCANKAGEV